MKEKLEKTIPYLIGAAIGFPIGWWIGDLILKFL
jgi:hypothetical protein